MNQARYFLPHLYALSINAPFWLGQNTGLKTYRQMIAHVERVLREGTGADRQLAVWERTQE